VVAASTSEVYGKSRKYPFHEDDELVLGTKSRWGYAASKAVDEFLALAYRQEFGLEVGMLRLFNTIGPRQSSEYGMVVPRFVRQALRGQPITVYGDGEQKRCFCDVGDVVAAFAALSQKPEALQGVYNVGGLEEVSIHELAERIKLLTNSSSTVGLQTYEQAYGEGFEDVPRRVPDTSRLRAAIGWQPRRSLAQSLDRIIEFERGCMERGSAISRTESTQPLERASTGL
jgi:UDP-glucose 4-epimerase